MASIALDGDAQWTSIDRHPDFAAAVEAAGRRGAETALETAGPRGPAASVEQRSAATTLIEGGSGSVPLDVEGPRRAGGMAPPIERAPASAAEDEAGDEAGEESAPPTRSTRVPASHPDVVAFLDHGVRTGPTLGPKMGLVVVGVLLLIGLAFVAIYASDVGTLAIPAFLIAVTVQALYARWTVVIADRRGIGRLGWRRSWDDFESIDVKRREVTTLNRSGSVADRRVVIITRFRFARGPDLRVTTDTMTHTRELTRYAEITKAAKRNRVPESRLEKLRATVAAPKPSYAFPVAALVAFVLLALPITGVAVSEHGGDDRRARGRREPPRSLSPRPVRPEPVHVPPPSLGELTLEAIQRRARAADYEELDLSAGSDGLSHYATAEHRQSSTAVPRRFRVHFFDLDHLPSTGEPPPDDCRLFDEHVVCARGLGSARLLAELDPTVTLGGLADALEGAGHDVEGERQPHAGPVVDHLVIEVGDRSAPIRLRGASWRRALEDADEDTAAAVVGRQAMVVRQAGRMANAATFLEQIAGVAR